MNRFNPVSLLTHPALHIGLILLATCLCYMPGLNSLFLFDDLPNLDGLLHIQGLSPLNPGFWEFVLGGESGPTGRAASPSSSSTAPRRAPRVGPT